MPRVDQAQKAAVERNASSRVLGHPTEQQPGRHEKRYKRHRQQNEHRDEDELRGNCVTRPDLEVDARGHGIRRDQEEDRERVRSAR